MDGYEVVVHTHHGILLSHKREFIWLCSKEVDEPRAYYTEQSKVDRDKYHILTHIYGIQKDGIDEPICRAAKESQT